MHLNDRSIANINFIAFNWVAVRSDYRLERPFLDAILGGNQLKISPVRSCKFFSLAVLKFFSIHDRCLLFKICTEQYKNFEVVVTGAMYQFPACFENGA